MKTFPGCSSTSFHFGWALSTTTSTIWHSRTTFPPRSASGTASLGLTRSTWHTASGCRLSTDDNPIPTPWVRIVGWTSCSGQGSFGGRCRVYLD
jgi:hypothetical protein